MGLSCACDYFDKGDCDRWWEHGRPSIPEAGTRCCECNAPLPNENCDTILKGAVYEPDVERPPYPEDVMGKEPADSVLSRHWDQRYDALQAVLDDFDDEYGWDSECERFERFTTEYRCERCADLAFAFEGDEDDGGMGYCMIAPGELPEAHCDYMLESGAPEMIWTKNGDGVFNPRRMTRRDFAKRAVQRSLSKTKYFLFHKGWLLWLRFRLWSAITRRTVDPIMYRLGYTKRYDYANKQVVWKLIKTRTSP